MTSEVVWRPLWPQGLLEAICTWIPGYSRLLMSNLKLYDLRGHFEATVASEAVGGNMHMDTRVLKVADFKSKSFHLLHNLALATHKEKHNKIS